MKTTKTSFIKPNDSRGESSASRQRYSDGRRSSLEKGIFACPQAVTPFIVTWRSKRYGLWYSNLLFSVPTKFFLFRIHHPYWETHTQQLQKWPRATLILVVGPSLPFWCVSFCLHLPCWWWKGIARQRYTYVYQSTIVSRRKCWGRREHKRKRAKTHNELGCI